MNFIKRTGDNRKMKEPPGYCIPDFTDYFLSDSGAGSGYFFPSHQEAPVDSAMRFYMNRACFLLQKGWNSREAAEALGFPEYTFFCEMFRKYTGVSPDRYREWYNRLKHPP